MGRRAVAAVVAIAALTLASACGRHAGNDAGGRVEVVAGFYPLAEAAARVGGDAVEVTNLTPAGVEPHDLELTPKQVDRILDADLVLYAGKGFQPAVAKAAARSDGTRVDLLGDRTDPHFWLDPTQLAAAVERIERALAEADPPHRQTYGDNASTYTAELHALDAELAAGLARCERTELVTTHAAFSYLADRYHLTQIAIAAASPEAEPSAARLAELSDMIRAHRVTTVFSESLVSPRVAQALAREAGVTTGVLDPIEGLTKDEVRAGDDYATVMRRNLAALRTALGCS
jgi:zinc transport system substrate-binding protein